MELDLDQARRRAKELLRAARAGHPGALARMRDDRPPRLADAQRAVAVDLGFASWPALVGSVGAEADVPASGPGGAEAPRVVVRDAGLEYMSGHPVRISLRHRANRYDMDDMGAAVELAGRGSGWRRAAERAVDELGWNLNRQGVVCMQTVEGRDVDAFVRCTAEASLAVFRAILELEEA